MKILVFDLSAPYGHFRVPYTTTSPLTFPVPPKTALYGMFGAILGLDKKDYLKYFQEGQCKLAIGLKKPVQKVHIAENLINTKNVFFFARMDSHKNPPRTQINLEFLKDPEFRIYVSIKENALFDKLERQLKMHKSAYSLSLGLSECLANYKFVGMFEAKPIQNKNNFVIFSSILPIDLIEQSGDLSLIEEGKKYIRMHLPLEMKPDRELTKTGSFIMETNAKTIKARINKYYNVTELNENIVFF